MKRALILIMLIVFFFGSLTIIRQFNAVVDNIKYFDDNAPNINIREPETAAKESPRRKKEPRKIKDPETIFEEADYLVKIRIFKKIVIPVTDQIIYMNTDSFGSGSIVRCKKYNYCVLTAFHVVNDSSMTYFAESKDGSKAQMLKLIKGTTNYDTAALRFVDYNHIPKKTAALGTSSDLKPGARIYTMGSNLYGDFWFSPSGHLYTSVKAANPELRKILEPAGMNHPELLLFHTPIFQGFSGGPLVNKYGEVIGITIGYTGLGAEPIYLGSPIDGIKKVLKIIK